MVLPGSPLVASEAGAEYSYPRPRISAEPIRGRRLAASPVKTTGRDTVKTTYEYEVRAVPNFRRRVATELTEPPSAWTALSSV
jgi:hypothetical protein